MKETRTAMIQRGILAVLVKPGDRLLAGAMGFAAGVMIAVSLADLCPGAAGYYLKAFSPLGAGAALASLFAMGMLLAALLERCLPEEAAFAGAGEGKRGMALRSAVATGLALLLHNLPEGILTLFTGAADPHLGARTALAIAMHNIPEGLAVSVPLSPEEDVLPPSTVALPPCFCQASASASLIRVMYCWLI